MTTVRSTRILRLAGACGIIATGAMMPTRAFATCSNYAGGNCGTASSMPTTTTAIRSQTPNNTGLPFTGGDVVGLSLIGIGAVTGGTALVRSGRRRAPRTT